MKLYEGVIEVFGQMYVLSKKSNTSERVIAISRNRHTDMDMGRWRQVNARLPDFWLLVQSGMMLIC